MNKNTEKALRNLKMGGIYTPIIFGIIFISLVPICNLVDTSGGLVRRLNSLPFYNPPTFAIGGILIFLGINSLIYFGKYVKALEQDKKDSV